MIFLLRRIIQSLVVAVLYGVLITVYEDALPRSSEDGPLDWLLLSLLVAFFMTPLAWLFILLPVSCLLPDKSFLLKYKYSIPIGCVTGGVFSIIAFTFISYYFDDKANREWFPIDFIHGILPGMVYGVFCATLYSFLESKNMFFPKTKAK